MHDDTRARLAILETLSRYAWCYDTRDLDSMRACFTADGVFHATLAGHEGWGPFEGREAVVGWLADVMRTQNDQRRHCISNVVFRELDEARAVVDSYLVLTAVEDGALRVVCTGTYRDELVREDDVWRIRRKALALDNGF